MKKTVLVTLSHVCFCYRKKGQSCVQLLFHQEKIAGKLVKKTTFKTYLKKYNALKHPIFYLPGKVKAQIHHHSKDNGG